MPRRDRDLMMDNVTHVPSIVLFFFNFSSLEMVFFVRSYLWLHWTYWNFWSFLDELAIIVSFVNVGRGDGWVGVKSLLCKDPLSSSHQVKGWNLDPSCCCNKFEIDFCCLDECATTLVAYVCSAGVIGMWWILRAS